MWEVAGEGEFGYPFVFLMRVVPSRIPLGTLTSLSHTLATLMWDFFLFFASCFDSQSNCLGSLESWMWWAIDGWKRLKVWLTLKDARECNLVSKCRQDENIDGYILHSLPLHPQRSERLHIWNLRDKWVAHTSLFHLY